MGAATLSRFYSLHFLLPILLIVLVIIHLVFLHEGGSSNPIGTRSLDRVIFHSFFSIKDMVGVFLVFLIFFLFVMLVPNALGDPENFTPANPLVTPVHIQPE